MSFSGDVKRELATQTNGARHCQLAELSAIISFAGKMHIGDGDMHLRIETGNSMLKEKYRLLLSMLFAREEPEDGLTGEDALRILESIKMWDAFRQCFCSMETVDGLLIQQNCCKRAFIRGAFLACGSMSNPGKSYHFEIVCATEEKAKQLQSIISTFHLEARIVARKKYFVVYIKEGSQIVDILNVMEAPLALMELENIRILKEMRGSVNRQVNCETANINKTVSAALKQMEDITRIKETIGFDSLPENLQEIARARLERPEATLKELGESLNPPVGKSGVNHRLRKLSTLAETLMEKGEVSEQ